MSERLRAYVRERVHKDGKQYSRGAAGELAEAIGKPRSWVSHYVDETPERNADIDTALAICAFYGVNLWDFNGVTGAVHPRISGSGSLKGGSVDVPASRDRKRPEQRYSVSEFLKLKAKVALYETRLSKVRARARDIANIAAGRGEGRKAARTSA